MKKRYILFGYQIQNGEFCIVQQEGAAVEYIFDAYSNGDSLQQIATHMSSCGPPYRSSDNRWNKNIIARLLSCDIYCGTATYPAIITKELYFQVQQLRNEKSVSYSSVLQSFRDDMQCCCGERLYWYPKTHQWYCRHCGMWSNRIRPEELSQQLREKLFWICRHNERICSPQGASNIHSIESSRLSHEIIPCLLPRSQMPSLLFAKSCTAQSYNLPVAPQVMQTQQLCKSSVPVTSLNRLTLSH